MDSAVPILENAPLPIPSHNTKPILNISHPSTLEPKRHVPKVESNSDDPPKANFQEIRFSPSTDGPQERRPLRILWRAIGNSSIILRLNPSIA